MPGSGLPSRLGALNGRVTMLAPASAAARTVPYEPLDWPMLTRTHASWKRVIWFRRPQWSADLAASPAPRPRRRDRSSIGRISAGSCAPLQATLSCGPSRSGREARERPAPRGQCRQRSPSRWPRECRELGLAGRPWRGSGRRSSRSSYGLDIRSQVELRSAAFDLQVNKTQGQECHAQACLLALGGEPDAMMPPMQPPSAASAERSQNACPSKTRAPVQAMRL